MNRELIEQLKTFITPEREQLLHTILQKRTNYVTVAIEDIYQSHNASAVLRSCDCFGIQNVHIVEQQNQFIPNHEVDMGSSKWLSINKYTGEQGLEKCISSLKHQNYRVVATTPHHNDTSLDTFDLQPGPVALLFGTEARGLTDKAIEMADEYLKIPMYGFTESFNISVSVAIILHHLRLQLNNATIAWELDEKEKEQLLLDWLKNSIKRPELIIERLSRKKNKAI